MILIVNKTQSLIINCQLLNDVMMFRYDVVGRPGRMLYDDTGTIAISY